MKEQRWTCLFGYGDSEKHWGFYEMTVHWQKVLQLFPFLKLCGQNELNSHGRGPGPRSALGGWWGFFWPAAAPFCSLSAWGPLLRTSDPSAGKGQRKWIHVKHGQDNSYFSKLIFVRKPQLCSGKPRRGNAAVRWVMSRFSQHPLPEYNSLDKVLERFFSLCRLSVKHRREIYKNIQVRIWSLSGASMWETFKAFPPGLSLAFCEAVTMRCLLCRLFPRCVSHILTEVIAHENAMRYLGFVVSIL